MNNNLSGSSSVSVDSNFAANTIEKIDLFRLSPGLADLFRRLYQIRIDCGYIGDEQLEKQKQEQLKEYQKKLAKLDKFERQKVNVKQAIDLAESLLNKKKKLDKKQDLRLNNEIIKAITAMDKEMRNLLTIQSHALNKKKFWREIQMPIEMRKQREKDKKNFNEYIKAVKLEHVKLLKNSIINDNDDDEETQIYEKKIVKFESVESLQKAKNEIPTVDISEGLEQIQQAKMQQEGKIDLLLSQIQQIGGIANSISEELDKQSQLLNKMTTDVDKYNNSLDTTNQQLVKAIEKAGGSTRLLIILIILIVIVALLGIGWLLLELFVPNISRI